MISVAEERKKMGTNYYAVRNRPTTREPIHIGKASMGWLFHFQIQEDSWGEPPIYWHTYKQVKDWLHEHVVEKKDFVILNEYDEILSYDDFFEIVEWHQKDEKCRSNPHNFDYDVYNIDGYRFSRGDFS